MANVSLPLSILEEIGLEGLEGITLEGLWKRIGHRLKIPLPLNVKVTQQIWNFVKKAKCLHFYLLPVEREPLKVFDRANFIDPFFGATETVECPYNLYKYNPISTDSIRGSCEHFDTREELEFDQIKNSSAEEIENEYGSRFVIVASQTLRESLLIPRTIDANNIELNIAVYCILERLGRARFNGELTHGKFSLQDIGGDPIAFHHSKKKLVKYKLIACQTFNQNIDGNNLGGQLCHLVRFFTQFKPKHMIIMEKIIDFLKTKPNLMAEYKEVKSLFDESFQGFLRRLFKSPIFHKFIFTDAKVPYRAIYPDAEPQLWKMKNREGERSLHVMQLRSASIDSAEFWSKRDVDSDDEDEDHTKSGKRIFLDQTDEVLDIPLLYQAYEYIRSCKEAGASEPEIGARFGQSKLSVRGMMKNLLKRADIEFYNSSNKRQTVRRYLVKAYNDMRKKRTPIIIDEVSDGELANQNETNTDYVSWLEMEIENEKVGELIVFDEPAESIASEEQIENPENEKKTKNKQISDNIQVKVTEIDQTDYCSKSRRRPLSDDMLTDKMKNRLQFLQREIKSKSIIDDPSKLVVAMSREESAKGFEDLMCRKTFLRLLSYLCRRKIIRLWRIEFKYKSKYRALMYITNRNVDSSFSLMKSCIDQAKSKFRLSIFSEETRKESIARLLKRSKGTIKAADTSTLLGKRLTIRKSMNYGPRPKFVRMRTIHEYTFYLARVHQNMTTTPFDQDKTIAQFMQQMHFDDIETWPIIWNDEIDWRMFVPPLIKHNGFDNGWCLLSDCLFRMPLSIYVQVVNILYEIPGLDRYLVHPIKKHFLVKDLPLEIQRMLYIKRKHIATVHELMRRLCCLGLVQCGPHRAMKDQSFFYINRYATLYDTTPSEQGFYYVSDRDYDEKKYEFNTVDDVYGFWNDMHGICMNTKLNRKSLGDGTTPVDKYLPEHLMKHVMAIQPRQAKERDTGFLPGDRRGAGCLDSSFFPHLERNWSINSSNFKSKPQPQRKPVIPMRYNRVVRVQRDSNTKKREPRIVPVPLHKLKTSAIRRRVPLKRKKSVTWHSTKKRIRNKYDEVDRLALQQMNKLRVDWNEQEDNFLLLCKIAQMYLNPSNRPLMSNQVMRDLLHWNCKSFNKTALACRRRIAYVLKKLPNSPQINNSVLMCLNEIKENKLFQKRYGSDFLKNLRKLYADEKEFTNAYRIHFIDLVHSLSGQFYNLTNSCSSNAIILPKSIQEFDARFFEKSDIYDSNTIRFDVPETPDDIRTNTIVTLIHSTMCCCYDKTSWSIQLYEIYKDFPEKLLSMAMQKVRSDQMISHNKISSAQRKAHNRCLPLSSSSYHLSATYQQQMTTKIAYDLFDDAFLKIKEIINDVSHAPKTHALNVMNSAACFFITELLRNSCYDITIEVPKRILILDPTKRLPDDSFQGIYARFHEIFNYIPKVDLAESDETEYEDFLSKLPTTEDKESESNTTKKIIEKLDQLTDETIHYFCIIDNYDVSKPRNQLELNADGVCSLNCLKSQSKEKLLEKLLAKREIWYRLAVDQQVLEPLPAVVKIDDSNVVAVYSFLLSKGSTANEQQRNDCLEKFKQVSDLVDEIFLENDKDFIDDDFGVEYDVKSDMKKKLYDGAQINEKIHKFHDFLCVNTCKLSLMAKGDASKSDTSKLNEVIDWAQLNKKRDDILSDLIINANWSVDLKTKNDFINLMKAKDFANIEKQIGLEILNYIAFQGEMGATATKLRNKFEDKIFVQKILDILITLKLVMRTGVCELTFVHVKHMKPWIVNSYNLKRYDREAIEPMLPSVLPVSAVSTERKRKASTSGSDSETTASKRLKTSVAGSPGTKEIVSRSKTNEAVASTSKSHEIISSPTQVGEASTSGQLPPETTDLRETPSQSPPSVKKTFALKMAPWIRVNGSVNRRVFDKYAGTILLHCIENVGTTLFSLCTRFHYLLPVHVFEIVKYLEDFGCLISSALINKKPVSLFTEYESVGIGPATELDDFQDIVIEPTIDAVTKMTIFIGNKKYKEDFI